MQYEEILALVREVSKAKLTNFEYTEGNIHISMSCPQEPTVVQTVATETPAAVITPVAAVQETPAVVPVEAEKNGSLVKSPLVGTFYAAPSEDAEPFVKVGDTVKKGQTLGIVEAMKLMNEIESEYDGVVTEILVNNEEPVEYGQPLFRIEEK